MADTNPARIPDSLSGKIPVEADKPAGLSQPSSSFENYMQGTAGGPKSGAAQAPQPGNIQGPSPMDLTKPAMQTAGPSFDSLITQAKSAQDGLGTIAQQLKDPNLKLKRSQSQLLKHKLQDTNDHIRAAGDRAGVPAPEEHKMQETASPAGRFLSMIGQGQDDLMAVQHKIKALTANQGQMSAGDMMFMQIKMGQAQQEIEFSSTLLGKVIDALKQILNTQL